MPNITENNIFTELIPLIETTDAVLGGDRNAPANEAHAILADRTRFLKNLFDGSGFPNSASYSSSLNALNTNGLYFITATATDKPGTSSSGFCLVINNGNTNCVQYYMDQGSDELYIRRITSGPTYNSWKLVKFDDSSSADLATLQARLKDIANPSGESVIISGVDPFNINTGANTLQISGGVALIDNSFVDVAAYSGSYPVYLIPDGSYTVSEPVAGSYITFDPYTSQRFEDVMYRTQVPVGTLQMIATAAQDDQFDGTGLGRWKRKGFAIANGSNGTVDMSGFVPVGKDDSDTDFDTIGETQGSKTVTIQEGNLPPVDAGIDNYGLVNKSEVGENNTVANVNTDGSGSEPNILDAPLDFPYANAAGNPLSIVQPSKVVVFIQRV